jgi:CysZ protein
MLDAAMKALSQLLSPTFRTVLLKSAGLAIAVLGVMFIVLYRLLGWLRDAGIAWTEGSIGPVSHEPLVILTWLLAIALGFGLFTGAIFLMPAVTSLVASFFCDEIAEHVEREEYPAEPVGTALPLLRAIIEGVKAALLALLIYLCAMPFLFLAGFGAVIFFIATAYVLGRTYFELAAMRFHPVAEAKALRRRNNTTVFIAGLFIAAFVSIPIVNLATPLFGMAFMVHMYKRLDDSRPKQELLRPMS